MICPIMSKLVSESYTSSAGVQHLGAEFREIECKKEECACWKREYDTYLQGETLKIPGSCGLINMG